MSLFSLLSTAVAVPFIVVFVAFLWFWIRAKIAGFRKNKTSEATTPERATMRNPGKRPAISTTTVSPMRLSASLAFEHQPAAYATEYDPVYTASASDTLSYQPLSSYLGEDESIHAYGNTLSTLIPGSNTIAFEITDIPGINSAMEKELLDLGYSSIEQIARWGRADVRAVSATLDVDQQEIEDEWIAGARLILSIR